MKESSFNIKTHDLEVIVSSISECDVNTGYFGSRGIGRAIVLQTLTEALGNKMCFFFAFDDSAVRIEFVGIAPVKADPLAV